MVIEKSQTSTLNWIEQIVSHETCRTLWKLMDTILDIVSPGKSNLNSLSYIATMPNVNKVEQKIVTGN